MAAGAILDGAPRFPPLMRGMAVLPGDDPLAAAITAAATGTDPGLVSYRLDPAALEAALVLAPETTLERAMPAVFCAAHGFADALGALAPPEVGVHFEWPAGFRVNGARCGGLRAAASCRDADAEPDWLVIGISVPFRGLDPDAPGRTADVTVLAEEGCADIPPVALLEAWCRHTLVWLNTFLDDGMRKVHEAWRARAHAMGKPVEVNLPGARASGVFRGLDEWGNMLLARPDGTTGLVPLVAMLETT
ncbi:MAG: hypothetical protein D6688_01860 [Alphaproteobacteria bacterium]|nr:MAG: hypothetical protein D6688_01860 [Alphaproteobacteria bacterium]